MFRVTKVDIFSCSIKLSFPVLPDTQLFARLLLDMEAIGTTVFRPLDFARPKKCLF